MNATLRFITGPLLENAAKARKLRNIADDPHVRFVNGFRCHLSFRGCSGGDISVRGDGTGAEQVGF